MAHFNENDIFGLDSGSDSGSDSDDEYGSLVPEYPDGHVGLIIFSHGTDEDGYFNYSDDKYPEWWSAKALSVLRSHGMCTPYEREFCPGEHPERSDDIAIALLQSMGEEATARYARLEIVFIPKLYFQRGWYSIRSHGGNESVKLNEDAKARFYALQAERDAARAAEKTRDQQEARVKDEKHFVEFLRKIAFEEGSPHLQSLFSSATSDETISELVEACKAITL